MFQPIEAVTALGFLPIAAYGTYRGYDAQYCLLLAGTGLASFTWHTWGVLVWMTRRDPCTGNTITQKTTEHPWMMIADAVLTTLLLSRMVTLATPWRIRVVVLCIHQPLLVTTLITIALHDMGRSAWDQWFMGIIALWLTLLLTCHSACNTPTAILWLNLSVAGGCKLWEWNTPKASVFRSVLHGGWHLLSALSTMQAMFLYSLSSEHNRGRITHLVPNVSGSVLSSTSESAVARRRVHV